MNTKTIDVQELIGSLQNEVRILLHLAAKIDRSQLDYRPTPAQRSTIELLRYLSVMGPNLIQFIKSGAFDLPAWHATLEATSGASLDQVLSAIEKQPGQYAEMLNGFTQEELRGEIELFGRKSTGAAYLLNLLLGSHAAYRMQLFLYLKSSGRGELNTINLWAGMDAPVAAAVAA